MMTPIRILALILGSALFFPVSCTGSLYAGTRLAAWLDTRDVTRGDEVHRSFSVIVEPGVDAQPFRALRLYDLPRLLKEEGREGRISLLPSKSAGRIANGKHGWISYRVLEDKGGAMVIEVEDSDGDRMAWSRYQVKRGEKGEGRSGTGPGDVAPLASRMFAPDHMVRALPWALGLAFLVYGFGRWLRRQHQRQQEDGEGATV